MEPLAAAKQKDGRGIIAVVLGAVFLFVVGIGTGIAGYLAILMAAINGGCGSGDGRPICGPNTSFWVIFMPIVVSLTGAVLIGIGGGMAVARRRSSAPWQIGAWVVQLGAIAVWATFIWG